MRKAKSRIALVAAAALLAVVALQVVASAHSFDEETTTTLTYNNEKNKFKGRVKGKTGIKKCQRNRNVKLFKRKDGDDKLIGEDTTNDGGYWGIPKNDPNGHFYVKVKEKHVVKTHHNHRCRAVRKDIDV